MPFLVVVQGWHERTLTNERNDAASAGLGTPLFCFLIVLHIREMILRYSVAVRTFWPTFTHFAEFWWKTRKVTWYTMWPKIKRPGNYRQYRPCRIDFIEFLTPRNFTSFLLFSNSLKYSTSGIKWKIVLQFIPAHEHHAGLNWYFAHASKSLAPKP